MGIKTFVFPTYSLLRERDLLERFLDLDLDLLLDLDRLRSLFGGLAELE